MRWKWFVLAAALLATASCSAARKGGPRHREPEEERAGVGRLVAGARIAPDLRYFLPGIAR